MFDTLVTDLHEGDVIILPDDPDPCQVLGVSILPDKVDVVIFDPDIAGPNLVRMQLTDKVDVLKKGNKS